MRSKSKKFWRSAMAGFKQPSLLTKKASKEQPRQSFSYDLPSESIRLAREYAKKSGVTLNVLLQGAIGIAMNQACKSQDVVFGVTVSGRPPDIAHVEAILGSFVSNVPVRVRLSPSMKVTEWLRGLQDAQHVRSTFEYVSPSDVHSWSELTAGTPLFDMLLVSLAPVATPDSGEIAIKEMPGELQTAVPLTIGIEQQSESLRLRAIVGAGRQTAIPAEQLLQVLAETVVAISTSPAESTLGDLHGFFGVSDLQDIDVPDRPSSTIVVSDAMSTAGGREMIDAQMMQDLLRNEWERALGETGIRLDDNFFEVGGNSLTAASVHARIESLTRLKIPLITLFQSSTIRAMAETLVSDDWPNVSNCVLSVRDGDPELPPLFMIASPEVNSVGYALLASHLNIGRRAYVVQAPPEAEGLERLSPSILPRIAASYLAEVRALQPVGPYYLIGMCTGSQLAFEMAKQLRSEGESVPYVGIINTWAHYTVTRMYHFASFVNRCAYYLQRIGTIVRMPSAERSATVKRIARGLLRKGHPQTTTTADAAMARASSNPAIAPAEADEVSNDRHDPWIRDYGWVRNDPGEDKYPDSVTVYRIRRQQYWRTGDRDLGWGRHSNHTLVENLSGKHHVEILREPQVRDLARRMCKQLTSEESELINSNSKYRSENVPTKSARAQRT